MRKQKKFNVSGRVGRVPIFVENMKGHKFIGQLTSNPYAFNPIPPELLGSTPPPPPPHTIPGLICQIYLYFLHATTL